MLRILHRSGDVTRNVALYVQRLFIIEDKPYRDLCPETGKANMVWRQKT